MILAAFSIAMLMSVAKKTLARVKDIVQDNGTQVKKEPWHVTEDEGLQVTKTLLGPVVKLQSKSSYNQSNSMYIS
jgi:hypothetical protein